MAGKKKQEKKKPTPPAKRKAAAADSVHEDRPKRARKAPKKDEPEDFTLHEPEGIKIVPGRGKKLGSFPSLKESVEASKHSTDEVLFAHQFLYGKKKGKLTKKEMKENILEFSGFHKATPAGVKKTKKEIEKEDEDGETKFSKKAFALKKERIMDLCNFFALSVAPTKDEPKMDKDTLVDRLLDFLGEPHKDWLAIEVEGKEASKKAPAAEKKKKPAAAAQKPPTAAAKAKKAPAAKKTAAKKTAAVAKVIEDEGPTTQTDYAQIKAACERKEEPSEEVLRAWVRAYMASFDLDKATPKHAVATCSDKFGVDMLKRKKQIKEMLAEEM